MDLESVVAQALVDLTGARSTRRDAEHRVPKAPGLYAFYGDGQAWSDLGLSPSFDDQPLYVGKAEKSLNGRDVGTHFSTGKTGSSTVRRSLAALLVAELDLVAVPRNEAKPDGSAHFSLDSAGDERLSEWMDKRLVLATWVKPDGIVLNGVESAVLERLRPPLNLEMVGEPRERLRRARAALATASRSWSADTATISGGGTSVETPDPSLLNASTFTLGDALARTGIPLSEMIAIRHAYVRIHKDGDAGIHADSTDDEILSYTSTQSLTGFAKEPPRYWVILLPGQGARARLWRIVENLGEAPPNDQRRTFALNPVELLSDLTGRCAIQWASPRAWWVHGTTAAKYPILDIADVEPEPFPGFDHLVIDHDRLQAVVRDPIYAAWRTALSSVIGIYLITDTSDGRHYVGKADGHETLLQRWTAYATNGHGGNVGLKKRDATNFRYSVLRVLDPSSAEADINAVEKHYKDALDSRRHGLNEN